ncbi:acetyl-CoA synthetase-like protein, partial [Armillaria novae-zelandiae]
GRQLKVWKNEPPSMREFFLHVTKEYKDKTYVVYEEERCSFQEILRSSIKCAASLFAHAGFCLWNDILWVGDRVTICSRNRPAYLAAFWACHLLGAVSVLLDPLLPLEPLKHCLALAKCTLLILDPDRADMIQPIASTLKQTTGISAYLVFNDQTTEFCWAEMDSWTTVCSENGEGSVDILNNDPNVLPDDDAAIFFTSGTTGLPKAVLTSHRACLTAPFNASFLESRTRLRQGEPARLEFSQNSDVQGGILLPRIMCHIGPFASMVRRITCTYRGLKLVITRTWDPLEGQYTFPPYTRLLTICSVAIVIRELADHGLAGYPLESIAFTGATIPRSFFQSVRKAFPQTTVQQVYGMTETTAAVGGFAGRDYEARPESCGFMYPTNDVRIMKDGDNEAVLGEEGEIWVRGPSIMKGYFGDPVATDKVWTKDGWYRTGDLGNLDAQGYLCIKGRIKDIVICGGSNIDAAWVENVLYSVPGISEAALVGIPDELMDELAAALVTVRPEYKGTITEEYLLVKAEELLPKYAVPVMIIVHDGKFERNTSGKILKNKLRIVAQKEWERRKGRL